jgi:hypothetical protein
VCRPAVALLHTGLVRGWKQVERSQKDSGFSAVLVAALRFNYEGQPTAVIRGLGVHVLKPFFA